jgi:hypothetical protein
MIYLFTVIYSEYKVTEHYFHNSDDGKIYYVEISTTDDDKRYFRLSYTTLADDLVPEFEYVLPNEKNITTYTHNIADGIDTQHLINNHIEQIIFGKI